MRPHFLTRKTKVSSILTKDEAEDEAAPSLELARPIPSTQISTPVELI